MGQDVDYQKTDESPLRTPLELLPCPFCGGPVKLESAGVLGNSIDGRREFWGVVRRNTTNVGGACCMEQVPSASKKAAVDRWNMRNGVRASAKVEDDTGAKPLI